MNIKPKLFLNNSPQTQDENSLVFARNMRIDDDGCLTSDYGFKQLHTPDYQRDPSDPMQGYDPCGNIVGKIIGLNNTFYIFTDKNEIIRYKEKAVSDSEPELIHTAWKYSGGKIDGCVNTNVSGEEILTIAETDAIVDGEKVDVPLKHINLKYCKDTDDESFYTQTPHIPITNITLKDTYAKTIPNGTYVFYIRYEIRKDVYTPWICCSNPIFAGVNEHEATIQGGVKYINIHKDSAKSFILHLSIVDNNGYSNTNNNYKHLYSKFQLGFVISHDDSVNARIWKTFNMSDFEVIPVDAPDARDLNNIYFDYDNVTETDIDELTSRNYKINNVGNITSYKNKLYISNYKETGIDSEDLKNAASYVEPVINEYKVNNTEANAVLNYKPSYETLKVPCDYNNTKKCYDTVTYKHGKKLILQDIYDDYYYDFIINMETPIKGESVKMENAAKLYLTWDGEVHDPDLAVFTQGTNFIKEVGNYHQTSLPFKGSWSLSYRDACQGIEEVASQGSGEDRLVYYRRRGDTHPLSDRKLPFMFGTVPSDCPSKSPYTSDGIYPNYPLDELYPIHGYDTFLTNDRGFYGEKRKSLQTLVKTVIGGFDTIGLSYTFLNNGTNTFYGNRHVDTDGSILEDKYNYIALNYASPFGIGIGKISKDILTAPNDNEVNVRIISSEIITNLLGINLRKDYDAVLEPYNGQIQFYGINDSGQFILKCNNGTIEDIVQTNKVYVKIKLYTFKVENIESVWDADHGYTDKFDISMTATNYDIPVTFNLNPGVLSISDNSRSEDKQFGSLMPLSTYRFAINLVDYNGVVSESYPIGTDKNIPTIRIYPPTTEQSLEQITGCYYPSLNYLNSTAFKNLSKKYAAYFISVANVGKKIIQCFDFYRINNTNYISAIELDAMLYHENNNITVLGEDATLMTNKASYASSNSIHPIEAFGNVGFVYWESETDPSENNKIFYIVIDNENKSENILYNKCTPYLPFDDTVNFYNILPYNFYNSYRSIVRKPSFKLALNTYVSGNDIYNIQRNNNITLHDFGSYILTQLGNKHSIISNFNLNYLSLVEDIKDQIFRIGDTGRYKQICKIINSLVLSSIYELKSMYKAFYNETYIGFDVNRITEPIEQFDNTIRVSNVLSDETSNNSVFTFKATDYYNIPTNRGIIVKLFSIGNNIFVHTKSGFYKFDGNQTITSTDKDITLTESEPFTTGITSILDSEHGYGGINNKEAGCPTYDSYFFYDAQSNHIFAFNGMGGVQPIDITINKFLNLRNWTKCYTLHDEANKRVLFNFVNDSDNLTLSYNYKLKNFVSLHDISLENTFTGNHSCYEFKDYNLYRLFAKKDYIPGSVIDADNHVKSIYGVASKLCTAQFPINENNKQDTCFGITVVAYPKEIVNEIFDSVTIDADVVQDIEKVSNLFDLSVKQHNRENPINSIQIITDNCKSNVVRKTDTTDPTSADGYKGFKYDRGSWKINYFRNTLDTTNIFHYPDSPRVAYPPTSDNYSLIYGKYFVININFIDDKPIKIENIFIKTNNI